MFLIPKDPPPDGSLRNAWPRIDRNRTLLYGLLFILCLMSVFRVLDSAILLGSTWRRFL